MARAGGKGVAEQEGGASMAKCTRATGAQRSQRCRRTSTDRNLYIRCKSARCPFPVVVHAQNMPSESGIPASSSFPAARLFPTRAVVLWVSDRNVLKEKWKMLVHGPGRSVSLWTKGGYGGGRGGVVQGEREAEIRRTKTDRPTASRQTSNQRDRETKRKRRQ